MPLKLTALKMRLLSPELLSSKSEMFNRIVSDLPNDGWTLENFLLDLPGKWALSFSLWDEKDPVAYAILSRTNDENVHLHRFMVAKSWRRQGLGSQMINQIFKRLANAGAIRCTLKVSENNLDAQRFYLKHGFQPVKQIGEYIEFSLDKATYSKLIK